ncbi:SIR2 family protein [Paenibacillus dauci]|uniref:SIR2 family protein n=1 Tax=Paenibacillus dauci TaxID=1567106 RepID=UPI000619FAB3|nr:SIR2 family protein [Paenibacillus dauci]
MKIYDAAILALKELNKPSSINEILKVIKKNHWFVFNTTNEIGVLSLAIKRRTEGYAISQAVKIKSFRISNNLVSLIEDREIVDNMNQIIEIAEWKVRRTHHLQKIKQDLRSNKLALFLGAGVSRSAGIPTWDILLEKINASVYQEMRKSEGKLKNFKTTQEEDKILTDLLSQLGDDSPIINASFLESNLGAMSLPKEVHKALYGRTRKKFTSPTLKWLAKLCNHRGIYQVQNVITFNYDDLLEQHLKDIPVTCKSISKEEDEVDSNCLPVYHVHGYLPQFNKTNELNPIVLTEKSYHDMYTNSFSWSNITQLSILKGNTCLFIGLSMSDPNMRRILDIAASKNHNKLKHFALMQRLELEIEENQYEQLFRDNSSELLEAFLESFHLSRERHYAQLGIQIVWFEDLAEIPQLIKSLVD